MDIIKRKTIADQVIDVLINMIKQDYQPGDRFPTEQELMTRLGVSRTPLREALRALTMMNLIETSPGKGTFVRSIEPDFSTDPELIRSLTTEKTLRDLLEVRRIVETEAAALASLRAQEKDLEIMAHDVSALATKVEALEKSIPEDLDFHLAVLRATNNEVLLKISEIIIDFYAIHGQPPDENDVYQHQKIFEAIQAKDPAGAKLAMDEHLHFTEEHLFNSKGLLF